MKNTLWNQRHSELLRNICNSFEKESIRYFIIRNYHGLPDNNPAKDVDIMVDPELLDRAKEILKLHYKNNGVAHYYEVRFSKVHCCHGIDYKRNFSIHIDLIASYVSKGYELFSFDELYSQTENFKGFNVLNECYSGIMVFIYKQFNYNPILKQEYKNEIYDTFTKFDEFKVKLLELLGEDLSKKICKAIEGKDFELMLSHHKSLTKALRKYAFAKNPAKTTFGKFEFYKEKTTRLIFNYGKFSKSFSVMAPDGAGKTTFLDALIDKINFCFVNDNSSQRTSVYHFRPNLIPNLGALGERAKIAKQDTDFTNPHRAKPAGFFGSLIRISYYWVDYVAGFNYFVRKDVQYDKFSVFDRYSYDLLVDQGRTRINLPLSIRHFFVKFMPHPKIVFYLQAPAEVIFQRKQELAFDEIERQNKLYVDVTKSHKRFITLDSNRPVEESVEEAISIILDKYTERLI